MKNFDIVLSRPIENGMSCFEVLEHKISSLEQATKEKYAEHEQITAYIEQSKARLDNWNLSRRDRWTIEDNIAMAQAKSDRIFREYINMTNELKGMRKSIDVIIYISNYGGEVTQQNRQRVESILNY